jgi:hypothetical protein
MYKLQAMPLLRRLMIWLERWRELAKPVLGLLMYKPIPSQRAVTTVRLAMFIILSSWLV